MLLVFIIEILGAQYPLVMLKSHPSTHSAPAIIDIFIQGENNVKNNLIVIIKIRNITGLQGENNVNKNTAYSCYWSPYAVKFKTLLP